MKTKGINSFFLLQINFFYSLIQTFKLHQLHRDMLLGSGATIPNPAGRRWRIAIRPPDMEVSCEIRQVYLDE